MTQNLSTRSTIGLLPGAPQGTPGSGAPDQVGAGRTRRGSGDRSVVLVVAASAVAVVAAIVGFVLLNRGSGVDAGAVPSGHSTGSTAQPTATSTTGVRPANPGLTSGRNPFVLPGASAGSAGSPSTGAFANPSAQATTSATAFAPAPAATVTQTVTAPATYVGLYGFSGSKAVFWVNDTKYQVAAGGTFAGFTYTSKTTAGCAMVKHGTTTTTLCPGNVKQLG